MKIFNFHSLVPGVRFYRMTSPAKYLSSEFQHEIYFEDTAHEGLACSDWQIHAMQPEFQQVLEKVLKGIDLVVTQLVHGNAGLAVLQGVRKHFGIPIVLDLDDNVENVPYYNRSHWAYQPNTALSRTITKLLERVDAVTVTTKYLAGITRKYNSNVHVLPNSVDFDVWDQPVELPKKKSIRIGWAGAQTHEDDFKLVAPAIREILKKYKNVRLYFIGGAPECLADLRSHPRVMHRIDWYDIFEYPLRLKQWNWDIGIAPLRDNAFNRAKSNLRWIEYSAMGIPTVAGNVEPFRRSIAHRKTGMLAYEPDEWVEALSELIENEALRLKIGKAAYRKVKLDYNMKRNARLWNDVYETVIKEAKVIA